jgi:CRP/FNR family cyclic AMP-dependent transcriptional regulator
MKTPLVRNPGSPVETGGAGATDKPHSHRTDLGDIEEFGAIRSSTLAELNRRCHWFTLDAGDVLIPAGERIDRVFFLLEGELRFPVYTRTGKIVSLPSAHGGSLVNGVALVGGDLLVPYSIEAAGACTIASIGNRTFLEIIKDDPEALHAVVQMMVERQHVLIEQIVELSTLSVRSRLHNELLRLCSDNIAADGSAVISPIPTHTELAHRIGTHREAVARELSHLQSIGIVVREPKELYVPDVSRLTDLLAKADD